MVGHEGPREKYVALRDVISRNVKNIIRTTRDLIQGKQIIEGDEIEEFWAIKNISFEIKGGEAIGIIGRNGAGKSTLLKMLSRITEPTTGRIELKGRVASLLEVGTGFHQELTGRENIFLNGAILGMTNAEIKRKFDEIVAFADVEKFLDTPVKRYSSGMYVRLAFAVAAHLEPEILIVDEVLAVGDAQFQKKCLGKMGEVSRDGRTVIFVSHNMAAISALTNECIFLNKGELQFKGATHEAVKLYGSMGQDNHLIYSNKVAEESPTPKILSVRLKTSLPENIQICNEVFEVEINIFTPKSINRACIAVQIFDSDQVNHAHFWLYDTDNKTCRSPGLHIFKCTVPSLKLYMGSYRMRVFFSEPPGGEMFESLDGICPFEVVMPNNDRLFQWWPKESSYLETFQWETQAI